MVLLDNPLGEAQAQAPAALFGGKAGFENLLDIHGGNALARISHINLDLLFMLPDSDRNLSFTLYRIQGILQQVFDHPVEKWPGDTGQQLLLAPGRMHVELHFPRRPFADILHHTPDLPDKVPLFEVRLAADLAKPVGHELQPVHILLDLLYRPGIRIALLQHLHPAFQGGYRGAQLMGRLLGHTRPKLILRRRIADRNGINGEKDKNGHNTELYQRIVKYLIQQRGMPIIIPVRYIGSIAEFDLQWLIFRPEFFQHMINIIPVQGCPGGIQVNIARNAVLFIGLDNRDGLLPVADQVWQGKVHPGIIQHGFAGGYPLRYLLPFLGRDLLRQVLRVEYGAAHDDDGDKR